MTATARRIDARPPSGPTVSPWMRTRPAVLAEAPGVVDAAELACRVAAGTAWLPALAACEATWKGSHHSVSLSRVLHVLSVLCFAFWQPTPGRGPGGRFLVSLTAERWLKGAVQHREPGADGQPGPLVPGSLARLLGLSHTHVFRVLRLLVDLDLVEVVNTRDPRRSKWGRCQTSNVYRPTLRLLRWLTDGAPPADLLPKPQNVRPPESATPEGGSSFLKSSQEVEQAEGGTSAPEASSPPSSPETRPSPPGGLSMAGDREPSREGARLVGRVAPERPSEGRQLLVAGVAPRPSSPPAPPPPSGPGEPERVSDDAYIRARQLPLPSVSPEERAASVAIGLAWAAAASGAPAPPVFVPAARNVDELAELRAARERKQRTERELAEHAARRRGVAPPPGDDPPGGPA
jgi:hypothetical protein